jgi:hypothetical protein
MIAFFGETDFPGRGSDFEREVEFNKWKKEGIEC